MRKSSLVFNVLVVSVLMAPMMPPVMAQSTLEQWQKLMPNTGNCQQVAVISPAPKSHFVDPYDAEMRRLAICVRTRRWGEAWKNLRLGLQNLTDPQSYAALSEEESERKNAR
jgi:hypothetical protein